jgi:hypothetical protein
MTGAQSSPPDARDLLRKYDLLPKRSFSQNFLIQPGATAQIADATMALGQQIVELGAGLGALTHALLQRGDSPSRTGWRFDTGMLRRWISPHIRKLAAQSSLSRGIFPTRPLGQSCDRSLHIGRS